MNGQFIIDSQDAIDDATIKMKVGFDIFREYCKTRRSFMNKVTFNGKTLYIRIKPELITNYDRKILKIYGYQEQKTFFENQLRFD